jgi:hypothetical protein
MRGMTVYRAAFALVLSLLCARHAVLSTSSLDSVEFDEEVETDLVS